MTRWIDRFVDVPHAPYALAAFRVGLAGFMVLQAALWYPDWLAFLGPEGWLQWEISEPLARDSVLHVRQIYSLLEPLGVTRVGATELFYWFYVLTGVGLLFGWYTRLWGALACLAHYIIMGSIPTFSYGVDIFLQMSLFYLAVLPTNRALSIDALERRIPRHATWHTGLGLRVLQMHLCLIYISAGLEKLLSPGWRDGNVLWRSLVQPDFRQFDVTWLASNAWIAIALSWFTIVVESGYVIAMWVPRLRALWLGAVIGLHFGIAICLGLWLFGLIMILLSSTVFGGEVYRDLLGSSPAVLHGWSWPRVLSGRAHQVHRQQQPEVER